MSEWSIELVLCRPQLLKLDVGHNVIFLLVCANVCVLRFFPEAKSSSEQRKSCHIEHKRTKRDYLIEIVTTSLLWPFLYIASLI